MNRFGGVGATVIAACVAGAIVLGTAYAARDRRAAVPIALGTLLVASYAAFGIAKAYARNVTHLAQWDYLCFWLYGQGLARHLDPYAPDALRAVPLPQPVDAEFARDVLAVGIPYPPWSFVLFRPLGWFADARRGAVVWCGIEFVAVLAAIVVLARWKPFSWNRAAAVAALVLFLPPSLATADLAQTIPLTLLFLALYLTRRDKRDAGIWLALAIGVKPFVLLLLVVPLLRRRWTEIGATLGTLAVLAAVGLAVAGPSALVDYFRESPLARTSGSVITEGNNVPVIAYLLRAAHTVPMNAVTLPHTLVALEVALLLIGVVATAFVVRRDPVLATCGLLAAALLVYPQSNIHYAQLLALPLVVLWSRLACANRPIATAALFSAVYALLAVAGGAETMYATLLVAAACFVVGARRDDATVRSKRAEAR